MKDFNQVLDKLNTTLSNQYQMPYSICFRGGNFFDAMAKTAEEKAPFGRVAIFYSKQTFALMGKELSLAIRKKGIKTVNVILPESTKTVDEICKLFNLPEDVRMVFVTDSVNYQTASYYATVNQISCGYLLKDLNFTALLSNSVKIKNKNAIDEFKIDCPRYVFINEVALRANKSQLPELYARLMTNVVSLIDYRVFCHFSGVEICEGAISLAEDSVKEVFSQIESGLGDSFLTVLYHGLLLEIANVITNGKLVDNSAITFAEEICNALNKTERTKNGFILQLSIKILHLYALYFSGDYKNLPNTPDYSFRVNKLMELSLGEEYKLLKNFTKQIEMAKNGFAQNKSINNEDYAITTKALFQKLTNQANVGALALGIVKNTFNKMGGKIDETITTELLSTCIKYCGDGIGAFNTATLMRDAGFMEFLP